MSRSFVAMSSSSSSISASGSAFSSSSSRSSRRRHSQQQRRRRGGLREEDRSSFFRCRSISKTTTEEEEDTFSFSSSSFDPLEIFTESDDDEKKKKTNVSSLVVATTTSAALTGYQLTATGDGFQAMAGDKSIDPFANFSPVCPASDGVFRVGQRVALSLAGDSNIENYRPLINDVLIRVRTELCVLESFVRETAIPFVQTKGLGWVLPKHETSETYLAGVVFVVGANFILLGSTKVVAILAIYHDLSLGLVARGMGGLLGFMSPGDVRKAREEEFEKLMTKQMEETKKVMLDANMSASEREQKTTEISTRYAMEMERIKTTQEDKERSDETSGIAKIRKGASVVAIPLKLYGTVSRKTREILEVFDTFCSRYFVAFTVTYIIVKTLHYVVFPDVLG